jgi:hypothetical protein
MVQIDGSPSLLGLAALNRLSGGEIRAEELGLRP